MHRPPRDLLHCRADYQAAFRALGLDAETIFDHPRIKAWRSLPDRENCTLDLPAELSGNRLHVKRYMGRGRGRRSGGAEAEVRGLELLRAHHIGTTPLVAWGRLGDGRSFLITEDLAGYAAADKLLGRGLPFERVLHATATLAARLHDAGLHHRDLYLCHYFLREGAERYSADELRLIDAGRVRRLPRLRKRRWIIKDLAQFWYSTTTLPVTDQQQNRWLAAYAERRGLAATRLRGPVVRKATWIAAHDAILRKTQPRRNISIPD